MAATWRKYYSKILDNTFLMTDNNAFLVFMKLIAAANNNGETSMTTRGLTQLANLSYSSTLRAVERLEANGMIAHFSTERGKTTIYKIKNWRRYQGSSHAAKQKTEQEPEQQTTDEFLRGAEQEPEQQAVQRRSRGGAERPKKQGRENELDKDKDITTYKGLEISDIQLLDEIKGFIDYRLKKDKGFTQRALDLNLKKLRGFYPDDIEMQRTCINECVARGWSGIYEIKEPNRPQQTAAAKGWF